MLLNEFFPVLVEPREDLILHEREGERLVIEERSTGRLYRLDFPTEVVRPVPQPDRSKPVAAYTRADWFDHWLTQLLPDVPPLDAYRALAVALHANLCDVGERHLDRPELGGVQLIPTPEQLRAALKSL